MSAKHEHEVEDNRALTLASQYAQTHSIPLVVLFVISPGDYESHDRSPRRIDFMLRNLKILKVCCLSICVDVAFEKASGGFPGNEYSTFRYKSSASQRDPWSCHFSASRMESLSCIR